MKPRTCLSLAASFALGLGAQEPSEPKEPWSLQAFQSLLATPVVTASGFSQDPLRAPAKVVIVTREDLRRRGYQDLEEVLHDYAGFDFEKGFGSHWSQIYMRGERSTNSDRFIFLWDGLIQNDIWAQVTWFEKQFPLTNIERIEIMYGPASLLYGSNAIGGIINVITRPPEEVDGAEIRLNRGSYGTRALELNLGGSRGPWRWMANGRFLRSDERDLSDESWTDNAGRKRYYGLRPDYLDFPALASHVATDRAGVTHAEFEGDPATGQGQLWILKNGYWTPFSGRFGRGTRNWFVEGAVGYGEWTLKAMSWSRDMSEEGWTTPQALMEATWNSSENHVQLQHERRVNARWSEKSQLLMRTTALDPTTEEPDFGAAGQNWNSSDPGPTGLKKVGHFGPYIYYKLFNREYRASSQFTFQDKGLQAILGSEFTAAKVYENYYTRTEDDQPWAFKPQHEDRDLAAFANLQAELSRPLSVSLGLRVDRNWEAGGSGGFGNLVTHRAALIYSPSELHTLKLIEGTAFQAPQAFKKYSTNPSRPLQSPGLKPEKMQTLEFSYAFSPQENQRHTLNLYLNQVENKIDLFPIPGQPGKNKFENRGAIEIFGGELESRIHLGAGGSAYLNLTANSAKDKDTGRRTGGIAPLQAQFGTEWRIQDRYTASLRGHWVAARDTARWDDPSLLTARSVPAYLTFDLALGWKRILPGTDLTLSAFNLTNRRYYDPGVRSADGTYYNGAILQQSFRAYAVLDYRF